MRKSRMGHIVTQANIPLTVLEAYNLQFYNPSKYLIQEHPVAGFIDEPVYQINLLYALAYNNYKHHSLARYHNGEVWVYYIFDTMHPLPERDRLELVSKLFQGR